MIRTMDGPAELWRMRKQFALQVASTAFMTFMLCLSSRLPSRFHISRSTGQMYMSELLPSMNHLYFSVDVVSMSLSEGISNQAPIFLSNDAVPFRFTPNMQNFLGPIFTEGILTSGLMAIGRSLTEPEVIKGKFLKAHHSQHS
jgi:transformation/transcription domain-associated protein